MEIGEIRNLKLVLVCRHCEHQVGDCYSLAFPDAIAVALASGIRRCDNPKCPGFPKGGPPFLVKTGPDARYLSQIASLAEQLRSAIVAAGNATQDQNFPFRMCVGF